MLPLRALRFPMVRYSSTSAAQIGPTGAQAQARIRRGQRLILDGAMGTELARVGATTMGKPGWTVRPHFTKSGTSAIREVHDAYLVAGADVLCTHTYNLCDLYFDVNGLSDELPRLTAMQFRAVEIAKEAAAAHGSKDQQPLVAAVLGPYGAAAEPGGDYDYDYSKVSRSDLHDFHRRRATVLASAFPDVLLFETLSSMKELLAIIDLLDELPTSVDCWTSFSVRGASETMAGDSWPEVVALVDGCPRLGALGVNCSPFAATRDALVAAHSLTKKPLLAYPNNAVWCKKRNEWDVSQASVQDWFAELSPFAAVVGGCCGISPSHISDLRSALTPPSEL